MFLPQDGHLDAVGRLVTLDDPWRLTSWQGHLDWGCHWADREPSIYYYTLGPCNLPCPPSPTIDQLYILKDQGLGHKQKTCSAESGHQPYFVAP